MLCFSVVVARHPGGKADHRGELSVVFEPASAALATLFGFNFAFESFGILSPVDHSANCPSELLTEGYLGIVEYKVLIFDWTRLRYRSVLSVCGRRACTGFVGCISFWGF